MELNLELFHCNPNKVHKKRTATMLSFFLVRQRRFELPRPLQALPPQSSASTNFAIAASEGAQKYEFMRTIQKIQTHYLTRIILADLPFLLNAVKRCTSAPSVNCNSAVLGGLAPSSPATIVMVVSFSDTVRLNFLRSAVNT